MASSAEERFLRQLSASNGGDEGVCGGQQLGHKEYCAERRGSRRWSRKRAAAARGYCGAGGGYDYDYDVKQQAEAASAAARKRVIVVVDDTSGSKHAMMWALTHVASKGDFLTLLHVLLPHSGAGCSRGEEASSLANSLGTLCKASRPEVEVEALVIQGPKLGTVLSQVKKLEASVLVLGQGRSSPCYRWLSCFLRSSSEEFVEQCIDQAECLTLAVRKQSKAVGGYLVSTRWQKNFWLLA